MPQRAEDFSLSPGQAVVIVVIVVVIVIVAANEFFEQFIFCSMMRAISSPYRRAARKSTQNIRVVVKART